MVSIRSKKKRHFRNIKREEVFKPVEDARLEALAKAQAEAAFRPPLLNPEPDGDDVYMDADNDGDDGAFVDENEDDEMQARGRPGAADAPSSSSSSSTRFSFLTAFTSRPAPAPAVRRAPVRKAAASTPAPAASTPVPTPATGPPAPAESAADAVALPPLAPEIDRMDLSQFSELERDKLTMSKGKSRQKDRNLAWKAARLRRQEEAAATAGGMIETMESELQAGKKRRMKRGRSQSKSRTVLGARKTREKFKKSRRKILF
ncbi:hypothetical protein DFJ73DRAFT_961573 [Zopfochytrium polystomum]|nr:hypothetical protein DFJ73DRAFT_961573 [Zopfochytrium polystomum]